jgi:hypothetical protein
LKDKQVRYWLIQVQVVTPLITRWFSLILHWETGCLTDSLCPLCLILFLIRKCGFNSQLTHTNDHIEVLIYIPSLIKDVDSFRLLRVLLVV